MLMVLFTAFVQAALVQSLNNWAQPCHNGRCAYDIRGPTSGTLQIVSACLMRQGCNLTPRIQSGSPNAVSDLTMASGWVMLSCHPVSTSQDVRAVCRDDDPGCSHVFTNGAEGTIVRLPEEV